MTNQRLCERARSSYDLLRYDCTANQKRVNKYIKLRSTEYGILEANRLQKVRLN